MVTGEVRFDEIKAKSEELKSETPPVAHEPRLAQPIDRCAAFIADLVVFMPLMAVAVAPFRKQALEAQLSGHEDAWVLASAMALGAALFSFVIYQTVFVAWWGATPGKRILGLRVEPLWERGGKPKAFSAFLRSLGWCVEMAAGFVPLLAVHSNEKRRSLHDRIADTLVVTTGRRMVGPPTLAETSMASGMLAAVLTAFSLVVTFQLFQFTSPVPSEKVIADLEESGSLCAAVGEAERDWIAARGAKTPTRLEVAVTLFQAEAIDEECLRLEADFALWRGSKQKPLAYLARGLAEVDQADVADAYFEKVCESGTDSEACRAATLLNLGTAHAAADETGEEISEAEEKAAQVSRENEADKIIASVGPQSAPYMQVMAFQHYESQDRFDLALGVLDRFMPQESLGPFVAGSRAKTLWKLEQKSEARVAMRSAIDGFESAQRTELARWFCSSEISENGCSEQANSTCSYLSNAVDRKQSLLSESRIAAAYLRSESCSERLDSERLEEIGKQIVDPEGKAYVKALAQIAKEKRDGAIAILKDIATRPDSAGPFYIEASAQLAALAKSPEELTSVRETWWEADPNDEGWSFVGRKLVERYSALRAWEKALEVGFKLAENNALDAQVTRSMVVAAYRSGQPRLAAGYLDNLMGKGPATKQSQIATPRMPASATSDSFNEVVQEMIHDRETRR